MKCKENIIIIYPWRPQLMNLSPSRQLLHLFPLLLLPHCFPLPPLLPQPLPFSTETLLLNLLSLHLRLLIRLFPLLYLFSHLHHPPTSSSPLPSPPPLLPCLLHPPPLPLLHSQLLPCSSTAALIHLLPLHPHIFLLPLLCCRPSLPSLLQPPPPPPPFLCPTYPSPPPATCVLVAWLMPALGRPMPHHQLARPWAALTENLTQGGVLRVLLPHAYDCFLIKWTL